MFVLKGLVKDRYLQMLRADGALASFNVSHLPFAEQQRAEQKLIQYGLSLPFWIVGLPDADFWQFIEFVEQMDMVIAPQSMYEKFSNLIQHDKNFVTVLKSGI